MAGKWNIDVSGAIEQQKRLSRLVREAPLGGPVKVIAGADAAFTPDGRYCVAAAAALNWPELQQIAQAIAVKKVEFPYIPGLLSFREAPVVIAAAKKLKIRPDVLIIDGQGRAHPRRFGLACHVGVELGWPTIGCAKSRLIGDCRQPGPRKGSRCQLHDHGELIGMVLRSRDSVKCLYISIGHLTELTEAVNLVLRCCRPYRLPEPIRMTHQLVSRLRLKVAIDKGELKC
ncbi:deoxyribonuclease V [Planctomycetota bacterium]